VAQRTAEDRKRMWRAVDVALAVVLTVGGVGYAVYAIVGRWGLDQGYIGDRWLDYVFAAWVSLYVTTIAFVIGLVIGFFFGWIRATRSVPLGKIMRDAKKVADAQGLDHVPFPATQIIWHGFKYIVRRFGDAFVAVIRGTPLFVQIVFVWSVLLIRVPTLNPLVLASIAGLIALTANTGGYQSEIFRAGLQTVHSGQVEAARALGLSKFQAMRHIILPQAIRLVIPPLTNEYIGLLKASSLLIVIGIEELTGFGRREAFDFFKVFESFALVTAIYLLLTVPLSRVIAYVERRLRIPGLGIQEVTAPRAPRAAT